jgi:hypothetical protein
VSIVTKYGILQHILCVALGGKSSSAFILCFSDKDGALSDVELYEFQVFPMKATSLSMFSMSTHSYFITHIFIYGYVVALQLPYFSDPLHSTEISSMKIVATKKFLKL